MKSPMAYCRYENDTHLAKQEQNSDDLGASSFTNRFREKVLYYNSGINTSIVNESHGRGAAISF